MLKRMSRFFALVGGTALLSICLVAAALPVAAQPGGPCSLISDDALSSALGTAVHGMGMISNNPATAAGDGPAVVDMCLAQLGSDNNALIIVHMVGVQAPGDVSGMMGLTQGGTAGIGGGTGAIDPSLLSMTQISGLGDTAVLLSGAPNGQLYANLIVWRGTEGFSLTGTGLSDPQTSLTAVAQAILATLPAQ